jgi:hypothetical protein
LGKDSAKWIAHWGIADDHLLFCFNLRIFALNTPFGWKWFPVLVARKRKAAIIK